MDTHDPFKELKKIFHEPKRLAIISALCVADRGLTFLELKINGDLTDGNLNGHLRVLLEADAIIVKKSFIKGKPRTRMFISDNGIDQFNTYLEALSEVLKIAQASIPIEKKSSGLLPLKRISI